MRNLLVTTLTIIALLLASVAVKAETIVNSDVETLISNHIVNHYKDLYKGEIEVKCGRIPSMPLELPDGDVEIKLNTSLRDAFVQRTIVRVMFYVDGQYKRAVGVPVTLALYENVWVATEPISRDDAITAGNVYVARRDISKFAGTAARSSNDLIDTRVKKTFSTGDILDHRFIEKTPIVVRNSLVEIVFKSNTVAISISGEAMENGQMGDIIRVKSPQFKKEYRGQIIDRGTILVNI